MTTNTNTTETRNSNINQDVLPRAWDTLMDYLHYNGSKRNVLTDIEWQTVYLRGNGFGDITLDFARDSIEWDWSHVRDSDEEGVARMHDQLVWVLTCVIKREKFQRECKHVAVGHDTVGLVCRCCGKRLGASRLG